MGKTREQVRDILDGVKYPGREFLLMQKGDGFLLQVAYEERCVETGLPAVQTSRKWYVSSHATESEIVETAWACVRRSVLHQASEHFTYRGARVYSQHFDVRARVQMAREGRFDRREPDLAPKRARRDVHGHGDHTECPDTANCECECLTCKRAWFAAGRPTPTG